MNELLNIGLAFLEGLALIASPCILPILPFILAGSITGDKRRPLGIIVGFIFTFVIFTFFARTLVRISGIDLNLVRNISFVLLFLFGLIMISSYLTEKFTYLTRHLANIGNNLKISQTQNGFVSGILFGGLIGIIWTPCAGPILAAVIVQTVLQQTNISGFFTILAFGIGAGIPMFVIALFGREIMYKFKFMHKHASLIRKLLGVIIILAVAYMVYGFGRFTFSLTSSQTQTSSQLKLIDGIIDPYPAPAFIDISGWINSPPLTMQQLLGKVVLIDFWDYSCINCIRTLPYLKDWYEKYHDKGLVIIGIHSPEFDFEKKGENVQGAVTQFGIKYPIALDNQFSTWRNYNNRYWPAHYLIDKNGLVVYQHFGEGDYDITENNIRFLLGLKAQIMPVAVAASISAAQTPETYLGYARIENFYSPESIAKDVASSYSYPATLPDNGWALNGEWKITPQALIATQAGAAIKLNFYAGSVFAVMGSANNQPIKLKITLDGKLLSNNKDTDVIDSSVLVSSHKLYRLIKLKEPMTGMLEITADSPQLEMYTFTFGS